MSVFSDLLLFLGRIFISQIFVIAGFSKLVDFHGALSTMTTAGVPYAEIMLVIAIVVELGGGLLLLFGWLTRLGALMLIVFVVLATYYFHSFWSFEAANKINQIYHFTKNVTIVGGLIYVLVIGSGRFGLDHLFRKKQ